jgi:serine/threonine protein phosphatase PrpC
LEKKIFSKNIKSGTTASCVYLQDKMAYMAWCGDSSIGYSSMPLLKFLLILGILQSNAVYTLSTPHKPEDPVCSP